MPEEAVKLTPKEAVHKAYEYFDELMEGRGTLNHRLLEGIKYDEADAVWLVTIGFDTGRERRSGSDLSFFESQREPIREFRVVKLRGVDGSFVSMESI